MSVLPGQKSKSGNLPISVTIPGKYGLCHYSTHIYFHVKHFRVNWWPRQEHTWQPCPCPWCCQWNMGELAYCANWVIMKTRFSSLCAFPLWLILQPCLRKPEPEVKFCFLLSLCWLTLSMSLSNSLITEAWLSSPDIWEYLTSSLCYLLVYYKNPLI